MLGHLQTGIGVAATGLDPLASVSLTY